MSSGAPVNNFSVHATLSVKAADATSAQTNAQTALADVRTALTALNNGTALSFPERGGEVEFDEGQAENGYFNTEGQLLVASQTEGQAQAEVEAAQGAIVTALAAVPSVTVTLQSEQGRYIFDLLQ